MIDVETAVNNIMQVRGTTNDIGMTIEENTNGTQIQVKISNDTLYIREIGNESNNARIGLTGETSRQEITDFINKL